MRLREATPADVPVLARLFTGAIEAVGHDAYTPEQVEAWASIGHDLVTLRDFILGAHTLIAEDETGPVGFVGLRDDGYVTSLYVRGDRQRQGIGSVLLTALMETAHARGLHRMATDASAFSRPLFERFGFVVVGTEIVERQGVDFMRSKLEWYDPAEASQRPPRRAPRTKRT